MRTRVFKAVVHGFGWTLCVWGSAQAPTIIPASTRTAQLCAEVRRLDGNPVSGLRSTDFLVEDHGIPLRLRLLPHSAQTPVSALVILSPAASFADLQQVANLLAETLPGHVDSFAFLGPHGEYVGFHAVGESLATLRDGQYLYKGHAQAIREDLERREGPRVILFLTSRSSNPAPDLIKQASDAGALLYEVGGNENQNSLVSGDARSSAPLGNYTEGSNFGPVLNAADAVSASHGAGATGWESNTVRSVRTVYVEASMPKAVVEMRKVSRGFYRLEVDVPRSSRALQIKPRLPGEYQFYAYTCSSDVAAGVRLSLAK